MTGEMRRRADAVLSRGYGGLLGFELKGGMEAGRRLIDGLRSGTTATGRDELRIVLDMLRSGDVLMVTRIDRLARSIGDLQDIVRAVKAKGASLKATEQPIDTSTADMLGVFAEFETNLRRERQMEGIAKAKAAAILAFADGAGRAANPQLARDG
jgi:DNA invertase Pin-like site-specific DNA recombinase